MGSYTSTKKERESDKLKYVIWAKYKDPVEESLKKAMEIEKERQKRGESWSQTGEMIEQYMFLEGNNGFSIVDTEDVSSIFKWTKAYGTVLKKVKVLPVLTRKEWEEATK